MHLDYSNNIYIDAPEHKQHIVVTDGYYYRSGFWFCDREGGYFYPDPDEPFEWMYWIASDDLIRP